jgi:hypothetical protein
MRVLGIALVTASVLLSSGGVVYRRSAYADVPAAAPEAQDEMCRVEPTPDGVEPALRRARLAGSQDARQVIVLGSSGFNYSRPGDPVPTPVRAADSAAASAAD